MAVTGISGGIRLPEEDEVHVWNVNGADAVPALSALEGILSPEERQRADRLVLAADRRRFVAAHGILRQLLGAALGLEPSALEFVANAFGKPALGPRRGQANVSFNLAHSGGVVLIALAAGRRVGVDVELVRADFDVLELAGAVFSARERQDLASIAPAGRTAAFFRGWTRKEAYVKACGEGLSRPLRDFSVTLGPDEPPGVMGDSGDLAHPGPWSVFDLAPAAGHFGAVVVEGPPVRLLVRPWTFQPPAPGPA